MLLACDEKDWERPVSVEGIGETVSIDRTEVYNLSITGINNTVTVLENNRINNLTITGFNNLLTIRNNTSVKRFTMTGADNTVYIPAGSGISVEDTGLGNEVIAQ